MNRAEIIEGLKDIYGTLYANYYFRKALDLKIIEACLELLENENALIDKILEILEGRDLWERREDGTMWTVDEELKQTIIALKKGEQE
ncbi:MAG: hypothetical protein IJP92_00690 [Lachnospiraceae bacterium]|nr:hypothetical protein [Lachnospiraceae bacterium]